MFLDFGILSNKNITMYVVFGIKRCIRKQRENETVVISIYSLHYFTPCHCLASPDSKG